MVAALWLVLDCFGGWGVVAILVVVCVLILGVLTGGVGVGCFDCV